MDAVRGRDLCWREEEWMRTEEPGERTGPVKEEFWQKGRAQERKNQKETTGDSRRCSRTRVTLAVHEEMAVQRGCRAG